MEPKKPILKNYADYRAYLADAYRDLKARDSKVSHRYINGKMGARSDGWFADVVAGRQKLRPRHVTPLAAVLRLDTREKEFLRALVDLESAETAEEKNHAYGRWLEFKGVGREQVEKDRFKYFERWYYPVLREMLAVRAFDGDYGALGAGLLPSISAREAKQAVSLLVRLGLTNPDAPAPQPVLVKQPAKTPHWHKILTAYMDLARPALRNFGREERDFSALTLMLSPESLAEAGEEIAALRRRLLALSEKDSNKRRVYQCLFQVFPVSQTLEDSRA